MKNIYRHLISFCLIISILFLASCKDDKKIVINKDDKDSSITSSDGKKKGTITSSTEFDITKKKEVNLNIDSLTKCINIVSLDKSDKKFWKNIDNSSIDKDYRNEKIEKDNLRMLKLTNEIYETIWDNEIDWGFERVLDVLSKDDKDYLKEEKEKFYKYVTATDDVYSKLFELQNEDDNMVCNKDYEGSYQSILNLKRRYAVEQKEYYYLAKGKVSFKYNSLNSKNDSKKKKNKKKKASFDYNCENDICLVSNKKFKDMVKDHYYNKFNEFETCFKSANPNKKEALKKAENIRMYWKKQLDKFHKRIEKSNEDELKSIIEKQYSSWKDYNRASYKLQKKILSKLKRYKPTVKGDKRYDLVMLEAYRTKLFAMEFVEYSYLITGNMDF